MLQERVGLYSFLRVAAEITFAGLHHLSLMVRVPCGCKHDETQQLFVHNRPWANLSVEVLEKISGAVVLAEQCLRFPRSPSKFLKCSATKIPLHPC